LNETGSAYDLVKVNLKAKTLEDGSNYLAVNPKGQVPALELDDGSVMTENAAVLQFIGDEAEMLVPETSSIERYRLQEWLNFIGSELHKTVGPLFNPAAADDVKQAARDKFLTKLAILDSRLQDQDYLMGDFSVADCYAFAILRWTRANNIDLAGLPNVQAYKDRIAARPKAQAAMEAEGVTV
jgi:glutathione S-transferase